MQHDAGLVVARAAAEQPAIAFRRLERIREPVGPLPRRLHVVVRVEQDGRSAVRTGDLAEHRRVGAGDLQEPNASDPAGLEDLGGRFGGAADRLGIEAGEGDGGDADQSLQLRTNARPGGVGGRAKV
jgi:hypothetical protein